MFELHTLPFYEAKSSKLNIHDLQCYSYTNINNAIYILIVFVNSEYTFNKSYIRYTKQSFKHICMYLNMIRDALY